TIMIRVKPVIIIRAAGMKVMSVSTTKVSMLRDQICSPCSFRLLVIEGIGSVCAWTRSGQKRAKPASKNTTPNRPLSGLFGLDLFILGVVVSGCKSLVTFCRTVLKGSSVGGAMLCWVGSSKEM